MALKLANNASGRLAMAITASATSLTLGAGEGASFPTLAAGEYFPLTVVRADNPAQLEIMRCTGRSGDTLTVVRAQENTAALTFSAGDVAELRLTSGVLESEFPRANGQGQRMRFSVSDEAALAGGVDGGRQTILVVEGGNVEAGLVSGPSKTFRCSEMDGEVSGHSAGIRFRSADTFGHLRVAHTLKRAWLQGGIDPTKNDTPDPPFWTEEIAFKKDIGELKGKRMLFLEATAPPGWTQDTSINDRVLRVVSSAGGGTGGSWTLSGLSASVSVGATTLSVAQMPSHTHPVPFRYDGGGGTDFIGGTKVYQSLLYTNTAALGGSSSHAHSASASISSNGSWRPAYVDVIACRKD